MLGFHLSRDLSVCHKYFNIALVRIGLLSSIGPRIVELSSPSYRDLSSFVLFISHIQLFHSLLKEKKLCYILLHCFASAKFIS